MRVNKMLRIGYHVSIAGGIFNGFEYAERIGCNSMQIFLSSPRSWSMREIGIEERNKFIERGKKADITPVVVHMPYLPNLASPNNEVYKKSVNVLCSVINECEVLGITYVVAHLGSELGEGKEKGIGRVVDAITKAKEVNNGVYLLLENQAGQKNSVGSKLEDLSKIYEMAASKEIGFCIDTCHLFAAGYDVRNKNFVKDLDSILGLDNIKLIHLNDAKHELGSGRDRHECIGLGSIGIEGFKEFLSDKRLHNKSFILETPHSGVEQEIKELEVVRNIFESTK